LQPFTEEETMAELIERTSWRKALRCGSGACVEVAKVGESYLVRSSTAPQAGVLSFTAAEWVTFTAGVRDGDFDWE
jgi:hypothetical protein